MGASGSVIALPPVFARVKEESEDCRAVALATADDLRDVRRANLIRDQKNHADPLTDHGSLFTVHFRKTGPVAQLVRACA